MDSELDWCRWDETDRRFLLFLLGGGFGSSWGRIEAPEVDVRERSRSWGERWRCVAL